MIDDSTHPWAVECAGCGRKVAVRRIAATGYLAVSAFVLTQAASGQAAAQQWIEVAKLTASDVTGGFGVSAAISDNWILVGAHMDDDNGENSGSVYIFERSGTTWIETGKLTSSDGSIADLFGISVGLSGGRAIVSAWGDDERAHNCGAAYIFERSGSGWDEVAKLMSSDGRVNDAFGVPATISGGTAVVGAWCEKGNGPNSGAAYVFEWSGSVWNEVAKLTSSDAGEYEGFTAEVFGERIVGSGYNHAEGGAGAVYVFEQNESGWDEVARLTASDGAPLDLFGDFGNVAMSGNRMIVGAPGDDDNGEFSGSAYIFELSQSGWSEVAKLTPSDGAPDDWFGDALGIAGDRVIVSAPGDDNGSGSAYIFEWSGASWEETAKLTPSDGAAGDSFGSGFGNSVAIDTSGELIVVGARRKDDQGAAYVFAYSPFAADFDIDGDVDADDFLRWQTGFGIITGARKTDGDTDFDGDVDGDDFLRWQQEFGIAPGSVLIASAIPEPVCVALLVSGLAAISLARWR